MASHVRMCNSLHPSQSVDFYSLCNIFQSPHIVYVLNLMNFSDHQNVESEPQQTFVKQSEMNVDNWLVRLCFDQSTSFRVSGPGSWAMINEPHKQLKCINMYNCRQFVFLTTYTWVNQFTNLHLIEINRNKSWYLTQLPLCLIYTRHPM